LEIDYKLSMVSIMAKIDKNYITITGLPVKVIAINSNNMVIQSLAMELVVCAFKLSAFTLKFF